MLRQRDNYGFSVPVAFRGKAQCAGNGGSLVKRCNAAEERHRDARRVSLSAPMDGVAPLGKGSCIAGEARLAINADKLTELAIVTLTEHK